MTRKVFLKRRYINGEQNFKRHVKVSNYHGNAYLSHM